MIWLLCALLSTSNLQRGGSRTAAASKIELFVMITNGFHPLTIITKNSILDIEVVVSRYYVIFIILFQKPCILDVTSCSPFILKLTWFHLQ